MGRHRTPEEKAELGERARALRAAGRSRREIVRELRIGEDLLGALLSGTPVPEELRRPNAKDDVRSAAVQLRLAGLTYDEIAAELDVSKSSCSLWLRDLPRPEDDPARRAEGEARRLEALRTRVRRDRDARDEQGREVSASAAGALGLVSPRDLVVALAVSYWCEGGKRKPWNRTRAIQWMNSDPVLVRLFLEGLALVGVPAERLTLRVHIHETADEEAARRWWSEQTSIPLEQFRRSTLKRHKPKTPRRNTGEAYRGCLCVTVLQGRRLYDVLEGIVQGLATGPRRTVQWHDGAAAPAEQPDGREAPSAVG